ncbi:hypothetical protein GOBAR_AA15598 [Gossypium barbadense]|uniref:Uncharacterized protein n=1 Tax=Gossypium barbadense TaxID=3634 RepID=A0A2P5XP61_GOSBA|nr:hypothetical protein GOBAR_AA15598 [Gossypium barbadense]
MQETVVSKGKGEVDHNDQKPMPNTVKLLKKLLTDKWKLDEAPHVELNATHKPKTHDKPKPRHDELNVVPNQLKVGDNVLLDAVDPCIATFEPNRAIPLTVLSIFPYGTVEVIHPKFGTFKKGTRACLRRCPHHERRHGHAIQPCEKRAKFFLSTGCDKWPRPYDMAVGESVKPTRRATRLRLGTVVEIENLAWSCNTPVPTTRAQD